MRRRDNLKLMVSALLVATGSFIKPVNVFARRDKEAFSATDYDVAINRYFSGHEIVESDRIKIKVRPVIENGAVVPVKVETDLDPLESITLFVDKNPNPLIASFDLSPNCLGFISTRIKVQHPSNIIAVVKTGEKVFINKTFVEVHEGGCG